RGRSARERAARPREFEVLLERRRVAEADQQVAQCSGVLRRRRPPLTKHVRPRPQEVLAAERLGVEVLEQELSGDTEVREGEVVLARSAGCPGRGAAQSCRGEAGGAVSEVAAAYEYVTRRIS